MVKRILIILCIFGAGIFFDRIMLFNSKKQDSSFSASGGKTVQDSVRVTSAHPSNLGSIRTTSRTPAQMLTERIENEHLIDTKKADMNSLVPAVLDPEDEEENDRLIGRV